MTLPLGATALVLPWVLDGWTPLATLPAEVMGALVFLGLGGVAIAHWFWPVGVARLGAAKAGLFLYLEPLATTGLAVPFLGESFCVAAAVALVLAGVFIAQHQVDQVDQVGRVLE